MPHVLFVLICLIWGSSFILVKKAVVCFSPPTVAAGRVIGGALALGVIWYLHGAKARVPVRRSELGSLLFVTVGGYVWPYIMTAFLVAECGSAFTAMMVSFIPLMTVLLGIPLLGNYPTRRQLIGVLGALVCLGLLLQDGLDRKIPAMHLALGVSVPFNYALTNTWIRRRLPELPALALSFYSLSAAGFILLPLAWALPGEMVISTDQLPLAFGSLALLGVFGTGIAVHWYYKLVQEQGPLFAGMISNLVPAGALLWGWADHEQVTPRQLVALVGILGMVILVQYGSARPSAPPLKTHTGELSEPQIAE